MAYGSLSLSLLERAEVGENLEGWTPLLELHLPVEHDTCGHDDQVRSPHALLTRQMCQQRDRLNRLAQTHLICKDAVEAVLVQRCQPVESDDLVFAQTVLQQERHRRLYLNGNEKARLYFLLFD